MTIEQLTAEVMALQKGMIETRQAMAETREVVTEIRQSVAINDTNVKAAFKRIDELKTLTDTVHKLALAVERQTGEMARMAEKLAAQQADINELKIKPARRWDSIVGAIITAVVGFVMAWVLKGGM